jgi:hypothetical protein
MIHRISLKQRELMPWQILAKYPGRLCCMKFFNYLLPARAILASKYLCRTKIPFVSNVKKNLPTT